jgi:hypothetical protein
MAILLNALVGAGRAAAQCGPLGFDDTACGDEALASTPGNDANGNSAFGYATLQDNTTGNSNTASGYYALGLNTTGFQNTASGADALNTNTTGSNNTAAGAAALDKNTTGSSNTAIGYEALVNQSTGYYNLGLGDGAGFNLTTGSDNIDIANPGCGRGVRDYPNRRFTPPDQSLHCGDQRRSSDGRGRRAGQQQWTTGLSSFLAAL